MTEGLLSKKDLKEDNSYTPNVDLYIHDYLIKLTLELIIGGLFDISKHSGA